MLSVAEEEGHYVVDRRTTTVKDARPPAQRVIFLLMPSPRNHAPVSGRCGQASERQGLAMPGAQPAGSLRYVPAELLDEGHVVVTGQPLIGCPQVDSAKRRASPVADLHSQPALLTE